MTIQKFRNMDLIFLTVVGIISDLLLGFFGLIGIQLFLSIAYPLIIICYIRWHKYGVFPNIAIMILHSLLYGFINDAGWTIAMLHSIAILGFSIVIAMIYLTKQHEQKVSTKTYLLIYFVGFLTVFFVEWGLFNLFNYKLNLISHAFNHVINFLFGLLIIFITSRQKDILINMNYYFKHKDKEV